MQGARRENHGHKIPEKLGGLAPNRSKDFTPSQKSGHGYWHEGVGGFYSEKIRESLTLPLLSQQKTMNSKFCMGFPGGASGKESPCQCRRHKRRGFDPWVGKIPLEQETATHSSVLAWKIPWTEELHGYSPWGRKESDRTERTPTYRFVRVCGGWHKRGLWAIGALEGRSYEVSFLHAGRRGLFSRYIMLVGQGWGSWES